MGADTLPNDFWALSGFFEGLFVDNYGLLVRNLSRGKAVCPTRLLDAHAWKVVRARYSGDVMAYTDARGLTVNLAIAPQDDIAVEVSGSGAQYLAMEFAKVFAAFRAARRELESSRHDSNSPAYEALRAIDMKETEIIQSFLENAKRLQ